MFNFVHFSRKSGGHKHDKTAPFVFKINTFNMFKFTHFSKKANKMQTHSLPFNRITNLYLLATVLIKHVYTPDRYIHVFIQ